MRDALLEPWLARADRYRRRRRWQRRGGVKGRRSRRRARV